MSLDNPILHCCIRTLVVSGLSVLAACGGHVQEDAGTHDASTLDVAPPSDVAGNDANSDGSNPDAGPVDASGPDAAVPHTGIAFVEVDTPIDLTPDGTTALLESLTSTMGDVYFYNTVTGQLDRETNVGDPTHIVTGISRTLRVSATHNMPVQAAVWSAATDWTDLGSPYNAGCDPNNSGAFDISADGSVTVGLVWHDCTAEAFRWTDASGTGRYTILQNLGTGSSRATVISGDGQIAAGFVQTDMVDRTPALWHADGTGILLDPTHPDLPGEVLSITPDGSVVAGMTNQDGFYWTMAGGLVNIGKLPGSLETDGAHPNAIAGGGQLIFGGSGNPWDEGIRAFVWTQAAGMRVLQDIAMSNGITVPDGTTLTNVLATSTDGSVVLGSALDATMHQTSFVMRLPVSAYGITAH